MINSARKRLFIHIGSHKTATTFLQNSFARNKKILDELGILYPSAGQIYQAHFKLTWALGGPNYKGLPLEEVGDWPRLIEEIDASPHDCVVISAETFSFNFDPSRLEALRDRYDVQIVYYLRSPDSFLESFYNQFVKDFSTRETRTLETYVAEQRMPFLNPMGNLRPWAEIFGNEAIRLRLFDTARRREGGILADFFEVIGCNRRPELAPADASILQKASLPPDALEYLRVSNPWLTEQEGHHAFVVRLVQLGQKNGDALQQTRAGILSLKARQVLRQRFEANCRRAVEVFLDSSHSPFPPAEAPLPPTDFDSRLPEATPAVMGKVAAFIRGIH